MTRNNNAVNMAAIFYFMLKNNCNSAAECKPGGAGLGFSHLVIEELYRYKKLIFNTINRNYCAIL